MTRFTPIALLFFLWLGPGSGPVPALAQDSSNPTSAAPASAETGQDIGRMQAAVAAQQTEIASLDSALAAQQRNAEGLEAEIERLQTTVPDLEEVRATALAAMDARYLRIIEDPDLDLGEAQLSYRQAIAALRQQEETIASKEQALAGQRQRIDATQRDADTARDRLVALQRDFDRARVARLHRELNVTGEIALSNTVTCNPDETIAGCMERGQEQARTLAQERFVERLFAAVTEADVVAGQRNGAGGNPTLIDSAPTDSGFRGQGDYFIDLTARIGNRSAELEACGLLGLASDYCGDLMASASAAALPSPDPLEPAAEEEVAIVGDGTYLLTVRSNVMYDEVFIDGVAYGSTKLDVMLPAGEYDVEVRKSGHSSFRERILLDQETTVRAQLAELSL